MGEIDDGRNGDGDEELVPVIEEGDGQDLGKCQLARERHREHDKRIDELGADGRTRCAQPQVPSFREASQPVENGDVGQLSETVCGEASDDDASRGTENGIECLFRTRK